MPTPPAQTTGASTLATRARSSASLVLQGILLNAVLGTVKLLGGIFGNTYALIADAAESFMDILASTLVFFGITIAARPPDADHPYGHGKAETISALFIALFIFTVAGLIAYHAIAALHGPPHQSPEWWTLPLLVLIVSAKTLIARITNRTSLKTGSTSLNAEAWHHLSDAITSAAAFIGIAIALIGGNDWATADEWAALFACVIIAMNGAHILRKAIADIMDAAVPKSIEQQIRSIAQNVPNILDIEKCRIRKSGLSYLVDIHAIVDANLTVRRGHELAHHVKDALIASPHHIADVTVHIEPDSGTSTCCPEKNPPNS